MKRKKSVYVPMPEYRWDEEIITTKDVVGIEAPRIEVEDNSISSLYELVLDMTLERVRAEKEKATRLSRRTLKMIALTQELHNSTLLG